MHKRLKNKRGFTIVELLIAIVVIGILSTLVIVGYQAYVRNARNTSSATVASSYINALNLYKLEKNNYPSFPETSACLGEGNDLLNDGSKTCLIRPLAEGESPIKESDTLNNALKPYFRGGKLPRASDVKIVNNPGSQVLLSGFYNSDLIGNQTKLDGVRHPWFITYFQEGASTKCPIGPVASFLGVDGAGNPLYSSTPPSTGYSFVFGSDAVMCYVYLPAIVNAP